LFFFGNKYYDDYYYYLEIEQNGEVTEVEIKIRTYESKVEYVFVKKKLIKTQKQLFYFLP
jgi:hypothetical protein